MPSEAEVVASSRPEVTREGIIRFMEEATRIVAAWPRWKQEVLRTLPPEPPPARGTKENTCSDGSQCGGVGSSGTATVSRPLQGGSIAGTQDGNGPTNAPVAASTSNPPEPPPAAKCDGSGTIIDEGSAPVDCYTRCPGCPATKPEPKDGAEEVARKIMDEYVGTTRGLPYAKDLLKQIITAAIRADRAARPDLDKVRELCEWVVTVDPGSQFRILAREVLAQLEGT